MLSHNIKVAFVKSVSRTKKSKAVVKTETSTLVGWVKKNFASKTGIGKAAVPNISEALRQQRKNDRTSTDLDSVSKREAVTEVLRLALNEELLKYDYSSQIDALYFTSFRIF